ncbi:MAG: hypothetical protein AUH87_06005 [Deltaproteobacteria bacterium 13_1_40CM_4_54_4]|nr:MAG: hypothetical protein AUH87_06005 [Deltaproteobacteria bacterium 13_1_40CM_4_54_4]
MNLLAALWVVLAFVLGSVSEAGQPMIKPESVPTYQPKFYPFEGGEKAVYRTSWNGLISVATAEIYTTSTMLDGKRVYQVRVEAKSSKILDLVWKMRDTITSTFDAKALAPSHFKFSQRENAKVIDTVARYNGSTKSWAVNRQQVGKKPQLYEFDSKNTLDPITAVYVARSVDFKVGDRLYFNIFGGRYRYLLELLVERKEPVELESGKVVEAYKIIPFIQNTTKGGYAERLNEATIWISADERRLPIKLSSKIAFGSVYMELIQDKHGTQSTAAEPGQSPS